MWCGEIRRPRRRTLTQAQTGTDQLHLKVTLIPASFCWTLINVSLADFSSRDQEKLWTKRGKEERAPNPNPQADRAKLLIMKLKITTLNYSVKIFCRELPCLALRLRFSFLRLFPSGPHPILATGSFLSPSLGALLPRLLVLQQAV